MQGTRTGMPAISSSSTATTAEDVSSVKIGGAGCFGLRILLLSLILIMSSEPMVPIELMCLTHGTEEIFFFGGTVALTKYTNILSFYCFSLFKRIYLEVVCVGFLLL